MKKIIGVIAVILIGFTSCTKGPGANDACSLVTCSNGGTCSEGLCTCPTGYAGPRCAEQVRTTGSLQVTNVSLDAYDVADDSVYLGTLQSKTSAVFKLKFGTHICRIKQKTGFIKTPIQKKFIVTITPDKDALVEF